MRTFRAIFLDRDGVLCRNSEAKERERDRAIGAIIGRSDFHLSQDMNMEAFWRVAEVEGIDNVNSMEREEAFWKRWYQLILEDHGVGEEAEELAAELYERYPFYEMMELYPEVDAVLEALAAEGYRLGVISDTFPSLEACLDSLGIGHYFSSFTASSVVGAGKPDPRVFAAATRSLDVSGEESIFVDDTKGEADGAREQGFTAFHLDRNRREPDFKSWTLGNLSHLLDFPGIGGGLPGRLNAD